MTDNQFDELLKQALTPEIQDYEIQFQKREKGEKRMKIAKILKPIIALAACMAIVLTTSFFKQIPEEKPATNVVEDISNSFTITVNAAQKTKMKKGEIVSAIYQDQDKGSIWEGDSRNNETSYSIVAPLQCEGTNIKTITYDINKGKFRLKGGERLRKSFTVSYDNQTEFDPVHICDTTIVSKKAFDNLWDWETKKTLEEKKAGQDEAMGNIIITCTVTYMDGTTDAVNIKVGNKIVSYKKANKEKKEIVTTFEMM